MGDVVLVGATGMVGTALIDAVGARPLTILARRASANVPPRIAQIVAPTDAWAEQIATSQPDVIVNCLGTTIKQAGSQSVFHAVDHDLVLTVAAAAKAAGARHFISVSSVGASAKSSNFYLRTKGEVEAALRALDFDRLDIIRPGLLVGERTGPARPGEAIAMLAAPLTDALMWGAMRRYRSIPATTVARAMAALAAQGGSGQHIHEHDAIVDLANAG